MIERFESSPLMHRVVAHGDTLYLAGVTAADKSQDIAGQTNQILATIEQRLAAAGSDRSKILSATIYMTDLSEKDALNAVWKAWFDAAVLPARAAVGVSELGPDTRVEIAVVAAR